MFSVSSGLSIFIYVIVISVFLDGFFNSYAITRRLGEFFPLSIHPDARLLITGVCAKGPNRKEKEGKSVPLST